MRLESSIIVFGGDDAFKIYLNRPDEVSVLRQLPIEVNAYTAAAVYCDSVFITGIGICFDEIWGYDAKNSGWNKCASMMKGRRGHSVAFVDHILYICGGEGVHGETDDVEAYNAVDDKCTSVGKLSYAGFKAGNCLPYEASLYIFGGFRTTSGITQLLLGLFNDRNEYANSVQVYDTKLNSCSVLEDRMPRNEPYLRAARYKNYAFLFGTGSCFVYNFDTGTWKVRDQFKTHVSYFGVAVHNEKLFVIGGIDLSTNRPIYRDDVKYVPIANILNNEPIEWKRHAKLPKPIPVFAFGKLEF